MREQIRLAAARTRRDVAQEGGGVDLCTAAAVVRKFLAALRDQASKWNVVVRYALAAVIALLDELIEDCE